MKAYPNYKDSGVPWLGDVPEHWEVRRTKYILKETDSRSNDGTEQLLSVSQYTGVILRKKKDNSDIVDSRASSLVGYKIVQGNDLVVNIMLAWNGSLGVSPYSGIVSPAYCTYRFASEVLPKYYHYLYKTDLYKTTFKACSTGVVESRLRLYSDKLGRIESLFPPLPEQQQISRYLDWQTSRINKFIKNKKKLITLLKEQKQNIINEAVTCGIDENSNIRQRPKRLPAEGWKDSGVEWLGEIPAHWIVRRLKYISTLNKETLTDSTDPDYLFHYVDVGSVSTESISKNLEQLNYSNAPSRARRVVSKGDTIISTVRTYLKAIYHFEHEAKDIIVSTGFAVLTPVGIFPKMLGALLLFDGFIDQVIRLSVGASYPAINADRLCDISVAFPEDKQEQKLIVEYIEKETVPIDQTIAHTEREIELIAEYRTRLVSDVVTGKVDVRDIEIPYFEPVETELDNQKYEILEEEILEDEE